MQENLNIELVEREYGSRIDGRKSLRLRNETYTKAVTRWERFLLWRLEQAEKKLVNTKLSTSDFFHDYGKKSKAEKKLERRSKIIAKLEEKLSFIPKETYTDTEKTYIENRAIKLKEKMMTNMLYHSEERIYSVSDETKIGFFEPEVKAEVQPEKPAQEAEPQQVLPEGIPTVEEKVEEKEVQVEKEEPEAVDVASIDKIVTEAMEKEEQEVTKENETEEKNIRGEEALVTPERQVVYDNKPEKTEEAEHVGSKVIHDGLSSTEEKDKSVAVVGTEPEQVLPEGIPTVEEKEVDPREAIAEGLDKIFVTKNSQKAANVNVEVEEDTVDREQIEEAIEEAIISSDTNLDFEEQAEIEEAIAEQEKNTRLDVNPDLVNISTTAEEESKVTVDSLKELREKLSLIQRKEKEIEENMTKSDENVERSTREYEEQEERFRDYCQTYFARVEEKDQMMQQRIKENEEKIRDIEERKAALAELMTADVQTLEHEHGKSK